MQMLTGLQALSAEMVLELFYNVISEEGVIGYEAFEWCFKTRLQKRSTRHLCHQGRVGARSDLGRAV